MLLRAAQGRRLELELVVRSLTSFSSVRRSFQAADQVQNVFNGVSCLHPIEIYTNIKWWPIAMHEFDHFDPLQSMKKGYFK